MAGVGARDALGAASVGAPLAEHAPEDRLDMVSSIEDFSQQLAQFLKISLDGPVNAYDSVYDDWGIDSLQAFQMIIIIESLAGADVPPPEVPEIFTVQDAYDYYRALAIPEPT